jgi:hypothetical protein
VAGLDSGHMFRLRSPMQRRFPPPWTVHPTPSGYRIVDGNGTLLAYVYGEDRYSVCDARLTLDEARRIAHGIARLPELLGKPAG